MPRSVFLFKFKELICQPYIISDVSYSFLGLKDDLKGHIHAWSDAALHRIDREIRAKLFQVPYKSEKCTLLYILYF